MNLRKIMTTALIVGLSVAATTAFATDSPLPVAPAIAVAMDSSRMSHSPYYHKAQYAVTCYSADAAGNDWYWTGPNLYVARNAALRLCVNNSPFGGCRITSCQ